MEKKLVPWVRPPRSDQKFVPYIPQPRPDPNGYVPYKRQPKSDKEYVPWVRPPKSDQKFVPYISRAERARREREAAALGLPGGVAPGVPEDLVRYPYGGGPVLDLAPNVFNPAAPDYHRVEFIDADYGNIVVYYYVPSSFGAPSPGVGGAGTAHRGGPGPAAQPRPDPREGYFHHMTGWFPKLVVGIHGAGEQHYQGSRVNITEWMEFAENHGVIIIAPTFARWYGQKLADPPGYTKPWWVDAGSQEDCAFIHEYCVSADIPPGEIEHKYLGKWDENLHDFTELLNSDNARHGDLALNAIVGAFSRQALGEDFHRFALFGYSGGGQFVNRYMMVHPERLATAAMGGAGTVMFPSFDLNYPFGMRTWYDDWTAETVTALGIEYRFYDGEPNWLFKGLNSIFSKTGKHWADWLAGLTAHEWRQKLATLLSLPVYIFAGSQDFDDKRDADGVVHPDWWTDRMWQGNGQMEKAGNLYRELLIADRQLKCTPISPLGNLRPAPAGALALGTPDVAPGGGETQVVCYREANAPFNVYLQPMLGAFHGGGDPLTDGRLIMKRWLIRHWRTMLPRPRYNPFTCVFNQTGAP